MVCWTQKKNRNTQRDTWLFTFFPRVQHAVQFVAMNMCQLDQLSTCQFSLHVTKVAVCAVLNQPSWFLADVAGWKYDVLTSIYFSISQLDK